FQNVVLPFPAVLKIQSGIKKLRYATLMGIKKAKTKDVKTLTAASLGVDLKTESVTKRIYPPQRNKQSQIFSGDPRQAAQQLVEKLRFEARVL
ncbi:MAG: electron transfer flavoprotein subunit beta, partial [Acidobacteriota bacterium]|nr:electron transfer flavoprotein subunit beta [Acidobacteriota bacterium]